MVGRFEYPKARKDHVCEVCKQTIPRGQVHHYQTSVFDGAWSDWRVHSDCAEMHWHHNFGRESDDRADDYYLDEYRGLFPHAVCRVEMAIFKSERRIERMRANK